MVHFLPYVLVPLYLWPSPGAWDPLYKQIDAHPNVHFQVIVNPDNGPGVSGNAGPGPEWTSALTTLNSKPNVKTVGYVHVEWTKRPAAEITSEIDTYAHWSCDPKTKINGIFFDEAPDSAAPDKLSYMHDVTAHARLRFPDRQSDRMLFNPGCPVPAVYYDLADEIVAFEDDYPNFSASGSKFPMADVKQPYKHKSVLMVNGFTGSAAEQGKLLQGMVSNNFTGVWVSTLDDYSRFSGLWAQLIEQLAAFKLDAKTTPTGYPGN